MKPICGECYWVWPFHAPWCSKEECRSVTAAVAIALTLSGCATARTAFDVAADTCRLWYAQHPERADKPDAIACEAADVAKPFVDSLNLALAKPTPEAITDALAAHPPLTAAEVCLKNPYSEGQP